MPGCGRRPSARSSGSGRLDDEDLAVALTDADPLVRRRAVTVAAHHPGVDLLGALADPDESVVEVAAWACGEREHVGDDVLRRLIELATAASADPLVRESSVAALGAIGDERGLDAILSATEDRPPIRRRAVLALAPFLDPDHVRAAEVDGRPPSSARRSRLAGPPGRRRPAAPRLSKAKAGVRGQRLWAGAPAARKPRDFRAKHQSVMR